MKKRKHYLRLTYGTALCHYCDVDSVLPESAGYPLTKEFLSKVYKVWFDSGSGIAHHTPFGFIKLLLDGKEVSFRNESVDIKPQYPDNDGCQDISYDFKADGKNHTLNFIIDDISSTGDIESNEMLETISFEKDGGKKLRDFCYLFTVKLVLLKRTLSAYLMFNGW